MNRILLMSFAVLCLLSTVFLMRLFPTIPTVEASGTIYIRANGLVEGTDKIVSGDNVTYAFTDNVNDTIVVERDNIVVDGASYTVHGMGSGTGIDLSGRTNVTIQNTQIKNFTFGIHLNSSSYNSMVGNNITNNGFSIWLESSSNNSISNSNLAGNATISWIGIWLESSSNNTIVRNNITSNEEIGIELINSANNSIVENSITDNWMGIEVYNSSNNHIIGNTFANNGLSVHDTYENIIDDNLVNDKPLVYLEGVSDYAIEDAGQIILVNCNRIKVENLQLSNATIGVIMERTNNTQISACNIANNSLAGISFFSCSANNSIVGNNITHNMNGVSFSHSSFSSIVGNTLTSNSGQGLQLMESSNNTIVGNNITHNMNDGIMLDNSSNNSIIGNNITHNRYDGISIQYSSNNNSIAENNVSNNGGGVSLYSSGNNSIIENSIADGGVSLGSSSINNNVIRNSITNGSVYLGGDSSNNQIIGNNIANPPMIGVSLYSSSNNDIADNNITASSYYGMYLEGSSNNSILRNRITNNPYDGIQLFSYSNNNSIVGNIVTNNSKYGFRLERSSNNTIVRNNITHNLQYGIHLYLSNNNSIHHNNFVNAHQIYSLDSLNIWDDGYPSGGNYWSDYAGVDADSDGIGDTPYVIDASNEDRYPLMNLWDISPPSTMDNYDNLWRTSDFSITLKATDDMSGVAGIYYRVNDGLIKAVDTDGQPLITTESAYNKLEYWSIDKVGNEESHHILTQIRLDKTAPSIEEPSREPSGDIEPYQSVEVSVNVTDITSQVENVTLLFTINDGGTWSSLQMNYNSLTDLYEASIPGQPADTLVKYKIVTYDKAGNNATLDGTQPIFVYQVVPEFSSFLILPLFMIATLSAALAYRRKQTQTP